jgi:hypothetical protein
MCQVRESFMPEPTLPEADLMLTGFSTELGHGSDYPSAVGLPDPQPQPIRARMAQRDILDCAPTAFSGINRFRLERFGKAMSGTGSWEAPGGVLSGKLVMCMRHSNEA